MAGKGKDLVDEDGGSHEDDEDSGGYADWARLVKLLWVVWEARDWDRRRTEWKMGSARDKGPWHQRDAWSGEIHIHISPIT